MLVGIPYTSIVQVWPYVSPLLNKAHLRCEGDYSFEDIHEGLLKRQYQLWVWYQQERIVAACVTSVIIYPRRKLCAIMMVGGKGLNFWRAEAIEIITAWAKEKGCTALEGYDTRAWLRLLKQFGWRAVWTTIRKEI